MEFLKDEFNEIYSNSKCVKSCKDEPDFQEFGNRCLKKGSDDKFDTEVDSFLANIAEDLLNSSPAIFMTCVVAVVFSYILLILFRYAAKYVIWIVALSIIFVLSAICIVSFVLFAVANSSETQSDRDSAGFFLFLAIIFGVIALIKALILYVLRKRITLVSLLFKETSKVLIDLPLTIFEPILTFIAMALTCIVAVFFMLIIGSSGDLEVVNDRHGERVTFVPNTVTKTAAIINAIAFVWFTTFILGCQNFVISSTVSQWFFTRSKNKLNSPMKRAFSHLVKFHIGSVCLGSVVIAITKIVRTLVNHLKVKKVILICIKL